ncbi:MAG: transcriptional repressor NrdR [Deltaproteobacteria bacterium]|nr:transcriptional repressor NrdR [Deltaproteobacteria bacterium]
MKCPFCSSLNNKVIDSRLSQEDSIVRRRRACEACGKRFTTYEQVEETFPLVVKKDGRREPYDRNKVIVGLQKATEKRPISVETIGKAVSDIEGEILDRGEKEVASHWIGALVMNKLKVLDEVAYVRFASVYRSFKDVGEFVTLIKNRNRL